MQEVLEAYEERRRYKREKCVLVGLVNKKLVYLEDISKGGAKLLSTEKIGEKGEFIFLDTHIPDYNLNGHIVIKSRIVWTREIEGGFGYYTGIEFKNEDPSFDRNINHIWDLNNFLINLKNKVID